MFSLDHPYTHLILDECRSTGLLRNQAAYVLATAHHETGRYKWLKEVWGPTAAQKRYEGRKDLGNTVKGDGKKFMGRGFVQITGRRNYMDWSKRLGLDLIKEPQLAEQPAIAARIIVEGMKLGTFTGKKLADYITLQRSDFVQARKIVNGMDKADLIAGYAREFDKLLKEAGYDGPGSLTSASKPASAPSTAPTPKPLPAAPDEREFSIIAAIGVAVLAVAGTALAYFFPNLFGG